jgi:hypothetical protein
LVDTKRKALEVLKLRGATWATQATYRGHDHVRAEPFDAVEIELAYLWDEGPNSATP